MIDSAYFLTLIFIFIRLSSFFILCKAFFPKGTPNILKVSFSLIFSFILIAGVPLVSVEKIDSNYILILYIFGEVALGVVLGLITNIIFDIVSLAGSWIDVHIGLSMISMMDPNSEQQVTVTGKLLHYTAMVMFFILNGHHILIKCLIQSFGIAPIGNVFSNKDFNMTAIEIIANYFFIGLKIAIPIVLIMIMTDICMGLISRAVPQINVMILGMPVKMLVGLVTVSIALPLILKIFMAVIADIPNVMQKLFTYTPIFLIFASEEKTEEATPKKRQDSKNKGQVARSKDIGLAITMIACVMVIIALSGSLVNGLMDNIIYYLGNFSSIEITERSIEAINNNVISKGLIAILPFILPIMIAGIVGSLLQTGFMFTSEPLKPSLGKLNPINGFKNMFSVKSSLDLVKNIIVVSIVVYIGYTFVKDNYMKLLQLSNVYLPSLGVIVKDLLVGIFNRITIALVVVAVIDYIIQIKLHNKDLRMTKQEIKEEYKQMEGDPQIKSKIKQKQREMSQRRMMQAVGQATVVITNPTHLAVAIKYEEGTNEAPKLVAKGADNIALKIKEEAKNNNVPIIENKPLARMIFEKVEIDEEIPQDMYQAVAEILVVIYKMKKR